MADSDPPKQAPWFRYADASSLGLEIAAAVTLSALAGQYLERHVTHWSPWTTLIAIGVGLGAAARAIVRTARNYRRQLAEQAEAERASQGSASPQDPPET